MSGLSSRCVGASLRRAIDNRHAARDRAPARTPRRCSDPVVALAVLPFDGTTRRGDSAVVDELALTTAGAYATNCAGLTSKWRRKNDDQSTCKRNGGRALPAAGHPGGQGAPALWDSGEIADRARRVSP